MALAVDRPSIPDVDVKGLYLEESRDLQEKKLSDRLSVWLVPLGPRRMQILFFSGAKSSSLLYA